MTEEITPRPNRPFAWTILAFALLVSASVLSIYALLPPSPLPTDAPATEFSANRAIQHDYVIAKVPHPAGSAANEKVQAYILDTMKALGIDAEVITTDRAEGHSAGRSHFVLGRIPGAANTKAFALMAHYDSVPFGPGASDDCSGVISLLEIARALKASPPLKNDVMFVFTDGEEQGEQGSTAFANSEWFSQVGVMANLEARGTKGNSLMFQTSDQNGWLIDQMVQAMRYPCASSLSYDVYKRMPFATDFDTMRRHGMKGFDFAFIDNFAWYHTRNDKPEHLDLGTLQQHGSGGLDLARHFGNIPLDGTLTAPDAMYFNAFGYNVVQYPLTWGSPLAYAAVGLAALAFIVGRLRGSISIAGVFVGILLWALTAALAALVAVGLLTLIWGSDTVHNLYTKDFTRIPNLYPLNHNDLYIAAYAASSIAVAALIYGFLCRWIRAQSLTLGAFVWWVALTLALAKVLPGGSFLAMWPVTFSALGMLLYFVFAKPGDMSPGWAAFLALFCIPALVMFTPAYVSFGHSILILGAPAFAALVVLVMGLLIPQLDLMARVNRWWLPLLSGSIAAGLLTFGLANSNHTTDRPKLDSLAYELDYDANTNEGHALWLSPDVEPDEWTSQFFPSGTQRAVYSVKYSHASEPLLTVPAPVAAEFPGPQITVVHDATVDNVRELTIHVASPERAPRMEVRVVSPREVLSASVFGKPLAPGKEFWYVNFNLFPQEGVEITLRIPGPDPVSVIARETIYNLPTLPGFTPRPDYIICTPNTVDHHGRNLESDRSFVSRTVIL